MQVCLVSLTQLAFDCHERRSVTHHWLQQLGTYLHLPTAVYLDDQVMSRNEHLAIEFGVVRAGQNNAAILLNRLLMGVEAVSQLVQIVRPPTSTI